MLFLDNPQFRSESPPAGRRAESGSRSGHTPSRRPPPFPQTFGSIHPLSWIDLDGRWMECGAAPVDEDVVATGAVADAPPGGWVQELNLVEVVEDVVEAPVHSIVHFGWWVLSLSGASPPAKRTPWPAGKSSRGATRLPCVLIARPLRGKL